MINVGFHASISGGVDKAVDRVKERDCLTFQIFTRNPRGWEFSALKPEEIKNFIAKESQYHISPAVAHMPYLPNLATSTEELYAKSLETLKTELERCAQLKIQYLVTHLGSHLGRGIEYGVSRISDLINRALLETEINSVTLLLENAAGTLHSMGSNFEDIKSVMDQIHDKNRVALCFDTAHAFAAGYDLRTAEAIRKTLNHFDRVLGLDLIKVIHLNDSKGDLGSGIDRHEHIALGYIGEEGFRAFLAFRGLRDRPFILETPLDDRRDDKGNIKRVRELAEPSPEF